MYDLWVPSCQKLAKLYLIGEENAKFRNLIDEVKASEIFTSIDLSNTNDLKGIGMYAEITALEIQYYLVIGDLIKLRELNDSLVQNKVSENCDSDPRIQGLLKEAEARIFLL
jgi:hypothetical protein